MELLLKRVYGDDGKFQYEELVSGTPPQPPTPNGDIITANFTPVWKLQSAAVQPSGGQMFGKYRIAPGIVHISYLLVWKAGLLNGAGSGSGTSRYYFELPPEIPNITGNIAEHGSVRMFDGSNELSGVPTLYAGIERAIIAEVAGQRWGISTPFRLDRNTQYISLGIWWLT